MKKLKQALKSKTIWVLIFAFIFNGFAAIAGSLPAEVVIFVNGMLTTLAAVYKLNPSQVYE